MTHEQTVWYLRGVLKERDGEIEQLKRMIAVKELERRTLLLPRSQWLGMAALPPVITRHNRMEKAA